MGSGAHAPSPADPSARTDARRRGARGPATRVLTGSDGVVRHRGESLAARRGLRSPQSGPCRIRCAATLQTQGKGRESVSAALDLHPGPGPWLSSRGRSRRVLGEVWPPSTCPSTHVWVQRVRYGGLPAESPGALFLLRPNLIQFNLRGKKLLGTLLESPLYPSQLSASPAQHTWPRPQALRAWVRREGALGPRLSSVPSLFPSTRHRHRFYPARALRQGSGEALSPRIGCLGAGGCGKGRILLGGHG